MATWTDSKGTVREVGTNKAVGGTMVNVPTLTASSSSSAPKAVQGSGYGSGNSYTGRETAYTWNDNGKNVTTYSNYTRYEDALADAIAKGQLSDAARLSSAVTYLARGDGSGFTNNRDDGYSSYEPINKGYRNAMNYEQDLLKQYGMDIYGRNPYAVAGTYADAQAIEDAIKEAYRNEYIQSQTGKQNNKMVGASEQKALSGGFNMTGDAAKTLEAANTSNIISGAYADKMKADIINSNISSARGQREDTETDKIKKKITNEKILSGI